MRTIFDGMAHLKIIDVSCPQQMLSLMQVDHGGQSRTALRSGDADAVGGVVRSRLRVRVRQGRTCCSESADDAAVIVSSGRGVHEALAAARQCAARGVSVGVVDMPSIDEDLLIALYESGKLLCLAEQNNGYILQNLLKVLYRHRKTSWTSLERVLAINTLDADGRPRFIHSGTYEELIQAFGLTPAQIADAVASRVSAFAKAAATPRRRS